MGAGSGREKEMKLAASYGPVTRSFILTMMMNNRRRSPMIKSSRGLSEKAKAYRQLFEVFGLFERSQQKFQAGVRTQKEFISPAEWALYSKLYGRQFLISIYNNRTLCVITTPTAQHGFLTEEMPHSESFLKTPTRPYLIAYAPDGTVETVGFDPPRAEPTAEDGQHRH
jgi:hypothetical protein